MAKEKEAGAVTRSSPDRGSQEGLVRQEDQGQPAVQDQEVGREAARLKASQGV